jgi:soluble lytic murein transglycosylase
MRFRVRLARRIGIPLALVASLVVPLPNSDASTVLHPATADPVRIIIQAKAAFQNGRLPELERYAAQAQQHPLAAWPEYWRLKLLLGLPGIDASAMSAHVKAFIQRHPRHPLAELAQRDWVLALVGKNLWDDVGRSLAQIPVQLDGPQMTCARAATGLWRPGQKLLDHADAAAALPIGNEASEACLHLVSLLVRQELVSENYLRNRARWAAQLGNDAAHRRLTDMYESAFGGAQQTSRGGRSPRSEQLLAQILKRTQTSSLSALKLFEQHQNELTSEQRQYAGFAVGAALWRRSDARAWPLMQQGWSTLAEQPEDNLLVAARETLRQNDWEKLLDVIQKMPMALKKDPSWRYWQAIALAQNGRSFEANAIFNDLKKEFNFYGLLSRETLGEMIIVPAASSVTLTPSRRQELDQNDGMQRSYTLLRAGLRAEAVTEWSAAMRGKSDSELIQAALHARESGFLDRMIAAADRTQSSHDFSLRFPAAFKEFVIPAAQEKALNPWWVLGLIRQESRFIPDIRSSAGATGLMQIMPATGKMLARHIGVRPSGSLPLTDIDLNIRLGTAYMRQLHDQFNGSALLASAAYNAGPSRAVAWRSTLTRKIEGAAFVESIPFNETRDYVKRVLTNAVLYHAVHTGEPAPSLKNLLGHVVPNNPS